jgi:hypothetical protein
MKRCPKCSRTFPDENQKFCTFDGGLLRADQPAFDPNLTVRATSKDLIETPPVDASEAKTSVRLNSFNETMASFGTSTFNEATTPAGSRTSTDLTPPFEISPDESAPTSADLSAHAPAVVASQNLAQSEAAAPAIQAQPDASVAAGAATAVAQPPKKRSVLPWVLAALVVLLLLGGGAVVAGYFFVVKPMIEAKKRPINSEPINTTTNTNSNTAPSPADTSSPANANTAPETKKEPEPFTPTGDVVQFQNSSANLDGDLAAHYVGFSFYYPKTWTKDPKSGVAGASNFARVDLQYDDPTYWKERVAFNWYPSKGTYEADADVFPQSAKKYTDLLSRSLENFEEVSHGDTTINSYKGYEVRFKGMFKGTGKGDLPYWGRLVFLPPGSETEKGGVAIIMLATSLADDVTSATDVGDKGGMALILDSFRFASQ